MSLLDIDLSWASVKNLLSPDEVSAIMDTYTPKEWDEKLSVAIKIAALPDRFSDTIFGELTDEDMESLTHNPEFMGRPSQLSAINSEANKILFMAGRGAGKTWAGGHFACKKAVKYPGEEGVILTRTAGDFKTVVKAIQEASPADFMPEYKKMDRKIIWPNNSYAILASSERPDQLRGPNGYWGWADEAAFLKDVEDASGMTALRNLFTCVRMGDNPQVFLSTTPKRSKAMNEIIEEAEKSPESAVMFHATTFDNTALPTSYIKNVLATYKGNTQLARQELYGEIIESAGTVFDEVSVRGCIASNPIPSHLPIRFIAVDPSVSDNKGDLCGIVVMGCTSESDLNKRTAYVLADETMQGRPDEWAERVAELCKKYKTKNVVYEKNQGGDVIAALFDKLDPTLNVMTVHASRGKVARAEPVSLVMTQGRVVFAEEFIDLINELIQYNPETSKKSPDRMDALVWGVTACLIKPPPGMRTARVSSFNPANHSLPVGFGAGKVRSFGSR